MEQSRQHERKTILIIAQNNGFPTHIIHSLRNKLTIKQQQKQNLKKMQQKWIVFTYYSLLLRRIINLSKRTNLRVAFQATNTIFQQLTEKQSQKSPSGIYKLKCNTWNNVYIGQSGRPITVRHKEHIRYVRTNKLESAYALHILNNRHEYGTAAETLELLKPCHKGTRMNCWETFYM